MTPTERTGCLAIISIFAIALLLGLRALINA